MPLALRLKLFYLKGQILRMWRNSSKLVLTTNDSTFKDKTSRSNFSFFFFFSLFMRYFAGFKCELAILVSISFHYLFYAIFFCLFSVSLFLSVFLSYSLLLLLLLLFSFFFLSLLKWLFCLWNNVVIQIFLDKNWAFDLLLYEATDSWLGVICPVSVCLRLLFPPPLYFLFFPSLNFSVSSSVSMTLMKSSFVRMRSFFLASTLDNKFFSLFSKRMFHSSCASTFKTILKASWMIQKVGIGFYYLSCPFFEKE